MSVVGGGLKFQAHSQLSSSSRSLSAHPEEMLQISRDLVPWLIIEGLVDRGLTRLLCKNPEERVIRERYS